MKKAGIIRNVDDLGRIVIPMELRKRFDIQPGDPLEITVDGDSIILEKYTESCTFCGGKDSLIEFCGKQVCKKCKSELCK